MQNNSKKKWLTAAVLFLILIPAGYYGTGFVKGLLDEKQEAEVIGIQNGADMQEGTVPLSEAQEEIDETPDEVKEPEGEVKPVETLVNKPVPAVVKKPKRELTEEEKEQILLAKAKAAEPVAAAPEPPQTKAAIKAQIKDEPVEEKNKTIVEQNAGKAKAAEQAKADALNNLKKVLKSIAATGKKDSRIPEGCTVVLNGTSTDYQAYRSGIRAHAFTKVEVKSIDLDDNGKVRCITVSAKVQNTDD